MNISEVSAHFALDGAQEIIMLEISGPVVQLVRTLRS